ncbi:tripartite tricarboxylate transporter permease, partial [bacterium]|nr:tripartite tricarboxylate transporter permease [bacterium]
LLKVPYRLLFPAIMLFCCIGAFGISNSVVDVWLMLVCAVVGYFFIKIKVEIAPLLLGLILGPMLEENLRRAMLLSGGDATVFFTRPISAVLLATVAIILLVMLSPVVLRKRTEIVESE